MSCLKFVSLFFTLAILSSFNLTAHQKLHVSQEILDSSEESVLYVVGGRAYLQPEKLMRFQEQWFLQNDIQQWASLGTGVMQDSVGYYLCAEPKCLNGHVGFKRIKKTWYCFDETCEYFFGNL